MTQNIHKLALLTWVVVYPMITLLLIGLEPLVSDLATPIRTFILTALMVPAMVYVVMPFAKARLKDWLAD